MNSVEPCVIGEEIEAPIMETTEPEQSVGNLADFGVTGAQVELFNETIPDKTNGARFAVCLQYWEGDRAEAMSLARLLVDVEKYTREDVMFLFIHRRDATPPDQETLYYVRQKFPRVHVVAGMRTGTGHPMGCNGLWTDTVTKLGQMSHTVKYAFTFEADVTPIRRDWINALKNEMPEMDIKNQVVSGYYHQADRGFAVGQVEHINGNMIVSTNITRLFPQIYYVPTHAAWDTNLAQYFKPHCRKAGFIFNAYRQSGWLPSQFNEKQREGYALVHGIRDTTGVDFVRGILKKF